MFSPSGALIEESLLDHAYIQLQALGFSVQEMPETRLRSERFAGDEICRANSFYQATLIPTSSVLMATRGGYGISRLLHQLNFSKLAFHLNKAEHILCGHSDITGLQLALLQSGAKPETLLHGPMACFDFGPEIGVNSLTAGYFLNAIQQRSVNIQWNIYDLPLNQKGTQFQFNGPVWGGNLSLITSLLATPWFPVIENGILILEDVNEPAYKIERMLLQLLHSGILEKQKAIVLGNFCESKPSSHDNGYTLKSAAQFVQKQLKEVPILMNFPFGHCTPKACWFQGGEGQLNISIGQGGEVAFLSQCLR
jgi:muramoyltetrapeptide carboxypeptidase